MSDNSNGAASKLSPQRAAQPVVSRGIATGQQRVAGGKFGGKMPAIEVEHYVASPDWQAINAAIAKAKRERFVHRACIALAILIVAYFVAQYLRLAI